MPIVCCVKVSLHFSLSYQQAVRCFTYSNSVANSKHACVCVWHGRRERVVITIHQDPLLPSFWSKQKTPYPSSPEGKWGHVTGSGQWNMSRYGLCPLRAKAVESPRTIFYSLSLQVQLATQEATCSRWCYKTVESPPAFSLRWPWSRVSHWSMLERCHERDINLHQLPPHRPAYPK